MSDFGGCANTLDAVAYIPSKPAFFFFLIQIPSGPPTQGDRSSPQKGQKPTPGKHTDDTPDSQASRDFQLYKHQHPVAASCKDARESADLEGCCCCFLHHHPSFESSFSFEELRPPGFFELETMRAPAEWNWLKSATRHRRRKTFGATRRVSLLGMESGVSKGRGGRLFIPQQKPKDHLGAPNARRLNS